MQIILRHPEVSDASAICEAVRESMAELHAWFTWCHADYSVSDAKQWITAQMEERAAGLAHEFIVLSTDGLFLGVCGVNQINRVNRMANLGYWIRSSETGRGIATLAVRETASWTFRNTDLERLEIVIAVKNFASQRVAEKVGAHREGVLRSRLLIHDMFHDAVMYSLIKQ